MGRYKRDFKDKKCSYLNMIDEKKSKRTVYYDLETTGLGFHNKHKNIEIVEIGAVVEETRETFRQYLIPPGGNIPRDASNVHGIYIKDGVLSRDGKVLEAVDCKTGLLNFLSWLKGFNQPIILAGYNSHNYDDWVISHNLLRQDLCLKEEGNVIEFLDVSKIVRPYLRHKLGVRKWSLTFAVKTCLNRSQDDAHDAVSDSVDTLDLRINLKDEETPLKALRDADYVKTMCKNIAKGLPIEEPKYADGGKGCRDEIAKPKVHKSQPIMRDFFKVIPKQKTITKVNSELHNEEQSTISKTTIRESRKDLEVGIKSRKRKRTVLGEISGNSSEVSIGSARVTRSKTMMHNEDGTEPADASIHSKNRKKRQRAPRKPRASRASR